MLLDMIAGSMPVRSERTILKLLDMPQVTNGKSFLKSFAKLQKTREFNYLLQRTSAYQTLMICTPTRYRLHGGDFGLLEPQNCLVYAGI